MKHVNTVFHQLLREIPRHRFEEVVSRYDGDKRIRSLPCWTQLCVMLYAQLCSRQSLRDVVLAWDSHASRHYHLGASRVKRSTLADANVKRSAEMYLELFYFLLHQSRGQGICHQDAIRLIDSTTIDLCKQQFEWASFRTGKSGVKVHTVYDPNAQIPTFFSISTAKKHDRKAVDRMPLLPGATYVFDRAYNDYAWFHNLTQRGVCFVSRMKSNAGFKVMDEFPVTDDGVLEDQLIRLSSAKGRKECPTILRRIRFVRKEDGKKLVFITNDLKRSAGAIAALYKQRWKIELFFKWIKQNLKIKRFIGTSENAVKIQIIIAMIAYLLLHMAHSLLPLSRSMQQLARLVSVNLMERRSLLELLTDTPPPPKQRSATIQHQLCLFNA